MRLITLTFLIFLLSCSEKNPVNPQNQSPEILSLEVFPKTIGPSDSVIIICNAIEPDGDTLFYDWITDGLVRIKGTNFSRLYNTLENTRIFYPKQGAVNLPVDTLWVQCFVRDGRGESDNRMISFIVKTDY
ncbi:MAG: hypothetical protein JXR46_08755 [Calditrichaceae bacterium]|nr:hypothetical protein [Calditrichaceae bacterium]MBN2709122.1 hypothetical protein [Calditrichaceae bacterium]RQV96077.1 MAG: hypothetical protein EH224_05060 [Calditrichota bacterium]